MKLPVALSIVLVATGLNGCASGGKDYPSLAIRDFERNQRSFGVPEGAEVTTPAPLPAEKSARIAALLDNLSAAHDAFMAQAPGARQAVTTATGTSAGDNRWAQAQVALASLDSQRSQAAVMLGDLDLMYVDTTLAFEAREEVAAARDRATAMLREEDAILARLREILPR